MEELSLVRYSPLGSSTMEQVCFLSRCFLSIAEGMLGGFVCVMQQDIFHFFNHSLVVGSNLIRDKYQVINFS